MGIKFFDTQFYVHRGFVFHLLLHQRCIAHKDITIPYICHFFTWAKVLENKIYTEKRQFFALNL